MQEINASNNPFPGLRPFESAETHLFFGRDGQSEELLRRLKRTRFLAVVGTSGSGKSSLVRAGLLPALQGGLMASAGSDWRIAILRPGGDPIGNLARALASPTVLGSPVENKEDMQAVLAETTLRRSSLGLVELVRRARTKLDDKGQPIFHDYENLLVVVDQFEELFRFKQLIEEENSQEDAAAFVKLLLEAVGQKDEQKIYIVLTMRSDFLGDCSQFWELPEAINNGQYLIPRMTRDERREAITGPVAVGQGTISEPLVNQLLNDVGDNPDQLPILQHALMRTWNYWLNTRRNGEPIDIPHYEAIGGMNSALSRHADEAYEELTDAQKAIAEKLFKGLTEKGTDNREIRRPMEVHEICELTGASETEVIAVIEVFRREGRSFLMPPPKDALTGAPVHLNKDSLIDISHESLIRNWVRLKAWVDEEAQAARIYRRLAETAVLHKAGEEALLKDPALQVSLDWREKNKPNAVWARRYRPEFETAISFLDASITARDIETEERERQRKRDASYKRTRLFSFLLLMLCIFAVGALAYAFVQKRQAISALAQSQSALTLIKEAKNEALEKAKLASDFAAEAQKQSVEAQTQKTLAEQQREEAEKATAIAVKQTALARLNLQKAEIATATSNRQAQRALDALQKVKIAMKEVDHQKSLSRIEVYTTPSGYPLLVDDQPAGTTSATPRLIELEAGQHKVEIIFPNTRWTQVFDMQPGNKYFLALNYRPRPISIPLAAQNGGQVETIELGDISSGAIKIEAEPNIVTTCSDDKATVNLRATAVNASGVPLKYTWTAIGEGRRLDEQIGGGNGENAVTWNLSDMPPGEYKVRVEADAGGPNDDGFITFAMTSVIVRECPSKR